MATSTEKTTPIGRAVARVRDVTRKRLRRGDITHREYALILQAIGAVKKHTRVLEKKEWEAWMESIGVIDFEDGLEDEEDWS